METIFQAFGHHLPVHTCKVDNATIVASNQSPPTLEDKMRFYGSPRAQMDNGARCSVTNLVSILRDVCWFDKKHSAPVKMKGATSNAVIVPKAKGKLRV